LLAHGQNLLNAGQVLLPICGAERRIIAFITESIDGRAILEPIGKPAIPPHIAQAWGPPEWYEDSGDALHGEEDPAMPGDLLAQPEYDDDRRETG
jgi:hypothetical protein